ncbi:TetR/AcrR family transcriptional regulator [Rhodococcus erythropolis]|uniref:TetR/AcrR family transcriptional regulator n=1 Tax=Rhodococcus erythropolis TaxID=1833 RepID=UPI001E435A44|nr:MULTISPECIES: TetR/AcrR family transcriptional regulator [Rhodococcus erythropolis group]MCZ4527077.1 TetR/AcrR family transcriptional regulator [Rhodococcus erythropolis]
MDAAFDLLVREGVNGVKISTLCDELGVTKGSFYWHFDDIGALMEAMADHWCGKQNDAVRELAAIESMAVEERFEMMAQLLIDERNWSVEIAVREWARSDEKVAEAVRELDQRIFDIVQESLLELDFGAEDARLRAGALVYAGIGFVHGRGSLPTPTTDELRKIFALLAQK